MGVRVRRVRHPESETEMRLPFRLIRAHAAQRRSATTPAPRATLAPFLRDPHWSGVALALPPALGCAVVRRLTDDANREWNVREMGSDTRVSDSQVSRSTALLFRCEVPGVRSEIRRVAQPLEALSDEELLLALDRAEY